MSLEQLDLFVELEKRDAILANLIARDGGWVDAAQKALVSATKRGGEYTSDVIQSLIIPAVGEPPSQSTWGVFILMCAKANLLIDTGKSVKCAKPGSRGRRVIVWRRT